MTFFSIPVFRMELLRLLVSPLLLASIFKPDFDTFLSITYPEEVELRFA